MGAASMLGGATGAAGDGTRKVADDPRRNAGSRGMPTPAAPPQSTRGGTGTRIDPATGAPVWTFPSDYEGTRRVTHAGGKSTQGDRRASAGAAPAPGYTPGGETKSTQADPGVAMPERFTEEAYKRFLEEMNAAGPSRTEKFADMLMADFEARRAQGGGERPDMSMHYDQALKQGRESIDNASAARGNYKSSAALGEQSDFAARVAGQRAVDEANYDLQAKQQDQQEINTMTNLARLAGDEGFSKQLALFNAAATTEGVGFKRSGMFLDDIFKASSALGGVAGGGNTAIDRDWQILNQLWESKLGGTLEADRQYDAKGNRLVGSLTAGARALAGDPTAASSLGGGAPAPAPAPTYRPTGTYEDTGSRTGTGAWV